MPLRVAVGTTEAAYNNEPPFHPDQHYPELPFSETSRKPNPPYALLRGLLSQLGNPLDKIIHPGQTVLIKPNFVLSFNNSGHDLFAVVTHPSIIRALVDYAYLALQGNGRIIIADAPQMDCDWDQLMAAQRLDAIQEFYDHTFHFPIEVCDLRNFALIDPHQTAYRNNRKPLRGDPQGTAIVNLGVQSAFHERTGENYYGADFNRAETMQHHHGDTHEYAVSKTVLSADVFLSVPKMKVHKKVGVTLNLKGLVGINTNKNYLVHHTVGTARDGGDQLPEHVAAGDRLVRRLQRWLADRTLARQTRGAELLYRAAAGGYRLFIKPWRPVDESAILLDAGNWHGNDSAWRMTADLAKIIFFADSNGQLHDTPQRKTFCVVDGIVGGENNGPLAPDAKPAGCLVAGANPIAVDMVTTRLMGLDVTKLRQFDLLSNADWDFGLHALSDIEIVSDAGVIGGVEFFSAANSGPNFHFRPHPGWVGHIELPVSR